MSYNSEVLADSPITFLRLNETSGTNANDEGSAANDGTFLGGFTLGVTGLVPSDTDTAVDLDGTSGRISLPDNAGYSINTTGELSLEIVFERDVATGDYLLFHKGGPTLDQYEYRVRLRGDTVNVTVYSTFGDTVASLTTGTFSNATGKHHIVVTLKSSTSTIEVYVDGTLLGSSTTTWVGTLINGTSPLVVGYNDANANQYFDGSVAKVAVYGAVLSSTRIGVHYAAILNTAKTASDAGTGTNSVTTLDTGAPTAKTASDVGAGIESRTTTDTGSAETGSGVEGASQTGSDATTKTASDSGVGLEEAVVLGLPTSTTPAPTLVCRVDWDDDGDFGDFGEDLADRVLEASWSRGRSADYSAEATGEFTIIIDNFDDRYTPDDPLGGLTSEQITPGRLVHSYASFLGVDYPQFTGYIERIEPNYADRTVTLVCYDPLRRYAETDVVVAYNPFIQRSAHDLRVAILEDIERGDRNLVHNPSLEVDLNGWSSDSLFGPVQGTLTRITTDAAQGSACAEWTVALPNNRLNVAVRMAPVFFAGQVYRASIYLRTLSGEQDWAIGLFTDQVAVGQFAEKIIRVTPTWTRHSVTFTVPTTVSASTVGSPLGMRFYVRSIAAGTVRLDGLMVTRGQALYPYSDTGSGRWPSWVGNGSFDGRILNGWYEGWKNLVANPSFETDTAGWSGTADSFHAVGSIARVVGDAAIGTAYAIPSGGSQTMGVHYDLSGIVFKAGRTYEASMYVKQPAYFQTIGIGSNGTPTDFAQTVGLAGPFANWTRRVITWVPTADRSDVHLFVFTNGAVTAPLWIDAAQVTERSPSSAVSPGYSDTGPGGGMVAPIDRGFSGVTPKFGSENLLWNAPATAGAGMVYDYGHLGGYFVGGQPYSQSVWLRPIGGSMPYKIGVAANKGDGTFDEASVTGTAPADVWTEVPVTWTPTADRATNASFGVVLYIMQTDATARTVYIDGVRTIPGSASDDFEMSHWSLGPEPDVYGPSGLSGSALSALSALNAQTLTRHWIEPTMSAPWYRYVARSRSELTTKVPSESWVEEFDSLSGFDIDRSAIVNIVPIVWSGGSDYIPDEASIDRYGPRPAGAISALWSDRAVPDEIAADLLARYSVPRARPSAVRINVWPSQLQRQLDDLVNVTFARLRVINRGYLILRLDTKVSESGVRWTTTYALEEHAF